MIRVKLKTQLEQPIHRGIAVLSELREAGVPVQGVLWPEGVDHGSLSVERDGVDTVYVWVPDPMLED